MLQSLGFIFSIFSFAFVSVYSVFLKSPSSQTPRVLPEKLSISFYLSLNESSKSMLCTFNPLRIIRIDCISSVNLTFSAFEKLLRIECRSCLSKLSTLVNVCTSFCSVSGQTNSQSITTAVEGKCSFTFG